MLQFKKLLILVLVFLILVSCVTDPGTGNPDNKGNAAASVFSGRFDFPLFSLEPPALQSVMRDVPEDDEIEVKMGLFQQDVRIGADGRIERQVSCIYTITGDSALDEWGSTNVGWSPWFENRPRIHVKITNPDGMTWEMTDSDAVEQSAKNSDPVLFSDRKVLRLPFAGVRAGSIVELSFTISEHRPFFDAGVSRRLFMHLNVQTGKDVAFITARLDQPFIVCVDILLLLSVLFHGGYGVVSICNDYLTSVQVRRSCMLGVIVILTMFALQGIRLIVTA